MTGGSHFYAFLVQCVSRKRHKVYHMSALPLIPSPVPHPSSDYLLCSHYTKLTLPADQTPNLANPTMHNRQIIPRLRPRMYRFSLVRLAHSGYRRRLDGVSSLALTPHDPLGGGRLQFTVLGKQDARG